MAVTIRRYKPVWAATARFLSWVAMRSGPLAALEGAESHHECEHRDGDEEDDVAGVDEPAHEAAHSRLEADVVEDVSQRAGGALGEIPGEPEGHQHEERDEEGHCLA